MLLKQDRHWFGLFKGHVRQGRVQIGCHAGIDDDDMI